MIPLLYMCTRGFPIKAEVDLLSVVAIASLAPMSDASDARSPLFVVLAAITNSATKSVRKSSKSATSPMSMRVSCEAECDHYNSECIVGEGILRYVQEEWMCQPKVCKRMGSRVYPIDQKKLWRGITSANAGTSDSKWRSSNMEYAKLNNDVTMPMEGIGTFLLSVDEAQAAVGHALADGYRLVDTANSYMNETGVGRAIKESGIPRTEIFLETKLWPSVYDDPDCIVNTLARLQVDYVDMLLLHQPVGDYMGAWKKMEKAYKEGKIKALGLSNFNEAQMNEVISQCEVRPTLLQTELHPFDQKKAIKKYLAEKQMVAQAWYPLGHGDKSLIDNPVFTELAKKYGKSNAQIILRWQIQDGNIIIPGSKNPEHIKQNLDIFDFSLTDEEMAQIAALDKETPYFVATPEQIAGYAERRLDFSQEK